jgi:Ca2+/Na+ antiporter
VLSTASLLKPRRRLRLSIGIVESVALVLLAAAYFILYFIFTPQLKPEDYAWLAYLMLAAYLVAFIYVIVMGLVKRE